jgi:hypothetical protein
MKSDEEILNEEVLKLHAQDFGEWMLKNSARAFDTTAQSGGKLWFIYGKVCGYVSTAQAYAQFINEQNEEQ